MPGNRATTQKLILSQVVPILGYIYFKDQHNALTAVQGDEIKGSFSLGMILGQIAFGTLGDALGRHIVYGKECMFTIFGTLMVVLLPWKGLSHQGIIAWMAVFRATTGVGAGGGIHSNSIESLSSVFLMTSRLPNVILLGCRAPGHRDSGSFSPSRLLLYPFRQSNLRNCLRHSSQGI